MLFRSQCPCSASDFGSKFVSWSGAVQGVGEKTLTLDTTKARTQLGWHPRLSLDEALQKTAEWYQLALTNPEKLANLTRLQIEAHHARAGSHSVNI